MQHAIPETPLTAAFHRATAWLLGLAWTAIVALATLPLIADVIDPLPPIRPANTDSVLSIARFVFESTFRGAERIWIIFAAIGLCVAVLLTLATILFLNRRTKNLGKLLHLLAWPALALPAGWWYCHGAALNNITLKCWAPYCPQIE